MTSATNVERFPYIARNLFLFISLTSFSVFSHPSMGQGARVQIVHNTPYTEAALVDIYIGDILTLDDFAFRTATPFLDIAADADLKIDVTAHDAADNTTPLFTDTLHFETDKTYYAIAAGDPLVRADQPAFDFFVFEGAREAGVSPEFVDALTFEGSPDIPPNVTAIRGLGPIQGESVFGEFIEGYLVMPPGYYDIDVMVEEDVILSIVGDAPDDGGKAVLLTSSGFFSPPTEDDPELAILLVHADGATRLLPENVAMAQFIHNSPYPASDTVDIYVNGLLIQDDFSFQSAMPFIELPSGVQLETAPQIRVIFTDPVVPDLGNPVREWRLWLIFGRTYYLVAAGNPEAEGSDTLNMFSYSEARLESEQATDSDVMLFHGLTGEEAIDVFADEQVWKSNLAYGAYSQMYRPFSAEADIRLEVAASTDPIASYSFDPINTPGLIGSTGLLMLSGTIEPGKLALVSVATSGAITPLTPSSNVGIELDDTLPETFALHRNYPNPFNPSTTIGYSLSKPCNVTLTVLDVLGRPVAELVSGRLPAGRYYAQWDAHGLGSGIYFYRLEAGNFIETKTLVISK